MRLNDRWLQIRGSLYAALAPLVALLFIEVSVHYDLFDRLENLTVDWRFQLRAPTDPPSDPRILLVAIDQDSLNDFGRWPWDRSKHTGLCELLALAEPAAVGFDLLFTENGDTKTDGEMADAMGKPKAVVTGATTSQDKVDDQDFGKTQPFPNVEGDLSQLDGQDWALLPIAQVRKTSLFGFVDSPAGPDGVRRKLPLLVRVGKTVFPSLSLQLLCQLWNVPPDKVHVVLGKSIELPSPEGIRSIPIDDKGYLLLNYRNKDCFTQLSYADLGGKLYEHFQNNAAMPANYPSLAGKILLVGQTEKGLTDMGPSPLEPLSPLVLVHMTALNNVLSDDYLHIFPDHPIILGWLLLAWLTLFYLRKKNPLFAVVVPTIIIVFYVVISVRVFALRSLELPIVWPIVFFTLIHSGAVVLRWLEEMRSKQQIKGVFASYIAPSVLNQLLAHPENIQLGGVRKPVTMLFSDIRGFTTLSETMGEAELVTQLNQYFEKMVDCVNRYRGTLHKYIGDAVMAVWGDVLPEKPEVDAANAVRSALAMRAELVGLNAAWTAANRPPFRIGIGLNFGTVLVGNIGATQRREFTVIGDNVNLASRLEGVTKEYKTDLVISESVAELVAGQFLIRTIGLIQVKGKTRPVKVYEVLADLKSETDPVPKGLQEWVATYERGMEAYLARNFTNARDLFIKCLAERSDDYCSSLYAEQAARFITKPPPKKWDGTQKMETK
jgi:adenylate cyclase